MASIKRVGFTPAQNQTADTFKALGHPARIAILELISKNKIPCKNLEIELQISKSTLSRHLQILFDSGVIGYNKILNQTYYTANPEALSSASEYLTGTVHSSLPENFEDIYFKIPEGMINPKL